MRSTAEVMDEFEEWVGAFFAARGRYPTLDERVAKLDALRRAKELKP